MKTKRGGLLLGLAAITCFTATVLAGTFCTVQSPLRPLGLPVTGQVQNYGSDATAASFEAVKSSYMNYCSTMLPEGVAFTGAGLYQLDPQRLYFLFNYAPRVYFIKDGACYKNALGATIATLSTPSSSILTGNTFTILPNASCSMGVCGSGSNTRTTDEPLLYGDFVQLPTVQAGQQLAFFLMSNMSISNGNGNGNNGNGNGNGNGNWNGNGNNTNGTTAVPQYVAYNGSSNNADGYPHMIAFFPDNSQYIIVGFEDIYGGGDRDCNDVMFVVDVGVMNALVWRDPTSLPK